MRRGKRLQGRYLSFCRYDHSHVTSWRGFIANSDVRTPLAAKRSQFGAAVAKSRTKTAELLIVLVNARKRRAQNQRLWGRGIACKV